MTDDHLFLGLLVGLYLWECLYWIAPGAVLFRRGFGTTWRVQTPSLDFENRLGVPVLGLPVPPLGALLASAPIPVSISPKGLVTFVTSSWYPKARPRLPIDRISIDDIESVTADGRDLRVNGRRLVRLGSPRLARRLVDLIGDLMELPEDARAARIDDELAVWLDAARARERLAAHVAGRRTLWGATNALFGFVVVLVPAVVLHFGLRSTWVPLALGWLVIQGTVAALFVVVHRRVHPEERGDRWVQGLTVLAFAPLAIRAHDLILRDLVGDSHPLAVGRALLDEPERARLAGLLRRDLDHPIPPKDPLPRDVAEVVTWFDERVADHLGAELGAESTDEPAEEIAADHVRCPRCLEVFLDPGGSCPDCRAVLS